MRTFKPTYRDNKGKIRKVKKWWIETRDHLGTIRRFAGHTDRNQTKILGDKINKLIVHRVNNEPPDKDLSGWIQAMESKLRTRLVEVGILTPDRATIGKALSENIDDYRESLAARKKSRQYIRATINAVRRIAADCRFTYWSDITAVKVESYLAELRDGGISYRRSNAYLMAIKMFTYWMIQQGRASESPIRHIKALDVELDRQRKRRGLSVDDLRRLLETTATQAARFGMAGPERVLLYRLAVETGLRANELRSLTVTSFDFERRTITVESQHTKNHKEAVLPLRADTAAELRQFLAGKLPGVQAFNVPTKTAEMLRADLEAAGIPYVDESGRYFDFHALRGETGTLLAAANVSPKLAQTIMRHSDINLTMSRYTHTLAGQEAQAVESLPDLSLPSRQKKAGLRTGTDNVDMLSPQGKNLA